MTTPLEITTQADLRQYFWHMMFPYHKRKKGYTQNDYCADVRIAWVDFVDMMHHNGQINEKLADRATLA
jgi:hypothetical protein